MTAKPKPRKLTADEKAQQWESAANHLERTLNKAPKTVTAAFDAETHYQRTTVVPALRKRAENIRRRGERD
jgi:hypothetical protein